MKRRGWLQLLGLAPVAASVLRLPALSPAPEPDAVALPPRRIERPEFRDLDGFATELSIHQDWIRLDDSGRFPPMKGLTDVRLSARLMSIEEEWQEHIGLLIPVRFSFPKRPEVYLWEGYLTELQHNVRVSGGQTTELEFRGQDVPMVLHPRLRS